MVTKMEEIKKILDANKVGKSSSEVRAVGQDALPRGGSKGKIVVSHHAKAKSHNDIQTVASSKCRVLLSQATSGMDF